MPDHPKRIAFALNAHTGKELTGGNHDVAHVYALLTNPLFGMCSPNSPKPLHECRNRYEFWDTLLPILDQWDIEDQLIFYFSGHGSIRRGRFSLHLGQSDFFLFDNLMNELDANGVHRAILILDACHSGAAIKKHKELNNVFSVINQENIPKGVVVIASSKASEISHELPDGSASVFTHLLCEGIETGLGGQCTSDGNISVGDVVTYIRKKLESEEKYSAFRQRPVFQINEADREIWIAKNKSGSIPPIYSDLKERQPVRSHEELKILYEKTESLSHPCLNASIDDLDWKLIEEYANQFEPDLFDENLKEQTLSKLKLFSPITHQDKNILHQAAVLCFCKRPEIIYPQAVSIFVVKHSHDSNFIREDIKGPLSHQFKQLIERTYQHIEKVSYIGEDGLRHEIEDIDPLVIRELISNAIIHRDYDLNGTVVVTITPEDFEVRNPGRFSGDLSWDELIKDPVSCPANVAILNYLAHLGVCERIGRGFALFKQHIENNGADSIIYKELPGNTTLVKIKRQKQKLKRSENVYTREPHRKGVLNIIKNLLLVLGSQLPVIGLAVMWWSTLVRYPITTAISAVVYEGLVLTWGMLGKDVWKQLKPGMVNATTDWVKVTVLNLLSNFRRRYNEHVRYEHRVFGSRGLRTTGQGIMELEQVFVELNIAPSHALQASANPLMFKVLPGSQPIWSFLRRLKKQDATALVILGPPGCGKTTLLKQLALTFSTNRQGRYRLRAYTPVLLFVREHVSTIVEQSLPLAELLQVHFANQTRYPELDPPPQWFARQLETGRCLLLFDGLDEVSDDHRSVISTWIDQQIREYPRCQFILTSRPQGYLDAPLVRAHVLEVMPFTPEQVERFVRNWYLATKIILSGKNDPGIHRDADQDAEDLLRRLQEQPGLQELTINPLLLTMIANVHNYRGALPDRRVELYAEICDVLLGHWQRAKGMEDPLSAKQKRAVLQPLAEEMMGDRVREISTQDMIAAMEPYLEGVGLAKHEVSAFLKNLQEQSGVLLENENGVWGFAHLTFQEYLCAAHWHETGKPTTWHKEEWQSLIEDGWWHEVLRLFAAQTADATFLVKACVQTNTAESLKLAANIAKEALKLDPALREDMYKALVERIVIRLRSEPLTVSEHDSSKVFKIDTNRRPLEYIQNQFEDQDEVVLDHTTRLMWQKSGTNDYVTYKEAQEYIDQLNRQNFSGYDDWRLPTTDELMSLLEPEKQSTNELHIDLIFDIQQRWCWSADKYSGSSLGSAWFIDFNLGIVYWDIINNRRYCRGVRS